MKDLDDFLRAVGANGWQAWGRQLAPAIRRAFHPRRHGDLKRWQNMLDELPQIDTDVCDFKAPSVTIGPADCAAETSSRITNLLQELIPWRKGPFTIHGVHIDTEWRSDWKWQRFEQHITSLKGRAALDVGCGSGYHCWRMFGEGARLVIGIDPSLLFCMQFQAVKHFAGPAPVFVLPLTLEQAIAGVPQFDTVFSMGVLYHRRSPLQHLQRLRDALRRDGELVLETLIVDGDDRTALVPQERYAGMRNVWFIPSVAMLKIWLQRLGFQEIRLVDVTGTTPEEQRTTPWMPYMSLAETLDPDNPNVTQEGYPAPQRAIILAKKS